MEVDLIVRAARRQAGLSQRGLARAALVPRSTIDRIEGRATRDPRLETMNRLLAATGHRLMVVDATGAELVAVHPDDRLRDRGGRRFPAHLATFKIAWFDRWWGWFRIAWLLDDPTVPEYGYYFPSRYPHPYVAAPRHCLNGERSDTDGAGLSSYDDKVADVVTDPAVDVEAKPTGLRERLFVPTLIAISLVTAMLSSLGVPLIPTLARVNHVSLDTGQWLLTVTQLTGALAAPVMGQLADGRYRRRVLLWAISSVLVGSIVAAAFTGFAALLVGRALQGVGLGLVPICMVMARYHLSPRRSTAVIGVLSITAATGVGLGYPLTGFIAETFNYRVAFWVGAGIVALALILAFVVLPSTHTGPASNLDTLGAVLFSVALTALLVALSEGAQWGWVSWPVIALVLGAAAVAVYWVRHELRTASPLVVLSHLRSPTVMIANLTGGIMGLAMYLFMPVIIEFVQIPRSTGYGFGASVAVAGLCLLPMSAGTLLATPIVRWIRDRWGPRVALILAQVLFVPAILYFAFSHNAIWEAVVTMGVAGVGIGLSFGTLPALIVSAVPKHEVGSAMGLYQVVRTIGFAVGSAVSAAIFGAYTAAHKQVPSLDGYLVALFVAAGICVVLGALAFLFPARPAAVDAVETTT